MSSENVRQEYFKDNVRETLAILSDHNILNNGPIWTI